MSLLYDRNLFCGYQTIQTWSKLIVSLSINMFINEWKVGFMLTITLRQINYRKPSVLFFLRIAKLIKYSLGLRNDTFLFINSKIMDKKHSFTTCLGSSELMTWSLVRNITVFTECFFKTLSRCSGFSVKFSIRLSLCWKLM